MNANSVSDTDDRGHDESDGFYLITRDADSQEGDLQRRQQRGDVSEFRKAVDRFRSASRALIELITGAKARGVARELGLCGVCYDRQRGARIGAVSIYSIPEAIDKASISRREASSSAVDTGAGRPPGKAGGRVK